MALNTCFRVTGWPCVKLFDIDLRWLTYSPENNVGVSTFSLCRPKSKGLSHVKCVSSPEHVLWSVDDTWSQYLILTPNDLHTALKVMQGSQVSVDLIQWDCHMWSMLDGLQHMFEGHWMTLGHNFWYWPQMTYLQPWKWCRGLKFQWTWVYCIIICEAC